MKRIGRYQGMQYAVCTVLSTFVFIIYISFLSLSFETVLLFVVVCIFEVILFVLLVYYSLCPWQCLILHKVKQVIKAKKTADVIIERFLA